MNQDRFSSNRFQFPNPVTNEYMLMIAFAIRDIQYPVLDKLAAVELKSRLWSAARWTRLSGILRAMVDPVAGVCSIDRCWIPETPESIMSAHQVRVCGG